MSKRFTLIDPIIKDGHRGKEWLKLEGNTKSIYKIFRVLSGTCNIYDEYREKKTSTATNYFLTPYQKNRKRTFSAIEDTFNGELSIYEIQEEFRKINENYDFYSLIEPEILNCVVSREQGRILESFLFLYRCLEGISYSIPLIYISKQKSFNKSYKALQKYIPQKEQDGELIFFRKFIKETLIPGNDQLKSDITLTLDEINIEELKSKYFKYYKQLAKEKYRDFEEDEYITFSFDQFFEFIIEIRNRYFHFLQGTWQENLRNDKIIYPDLFFKPIIDQGINWLALIFYEIIKFEMEKNER